MYRVGWPSQINKIPIELVGICLSHHAFTTLKFRYWVSVSVRFRFGKKSVFRFRFGIGEIPFRSFTNFLPPSLRPMKTILLYIIHRLVYLCKHFAISHLYASIWTNSTWFVDDSLRMVPSAAASINEVFAEFTIDKKYEK